MNKIVKKIFRIADYQGKLVHQQQTSFGVIEVYQDDVVRWMTFANGDIQTAMSLQSPEALSLAYMRTMMSLLLFQDTPNSLCLLGLGGGGFLRFLHHHFSHLMIDVVELSPDVIEIAERYFCLPQAKAIHLYQADGVEFMQQTTKHYDVLIVDMFSAIGLPASMLKQDFYYDCNHRLSEHGCAVINLLTNSEAQLIYTIGLIREAFNAQTICIAVKETENVIVFAFKDKLKDRQFDQLVARSELFKARFVQGFGLYIQDVLNIEPKKIAQEFPAVAKIVY